MDFTGLTPAQVFWRLGVDNGFKLYLNGDFIAGDVDEGYTHRWEYEGQFLGAPFINGINIIALALEDHSGMTAFDMQVDAVDAAVPEPGTVALLGLGSTLALLRGSAFSKRFARGARVLVPDFRPGPWTLRPIK